MKQKFLHCDCSGLHIFRSGDDFKMRWDLVVMVLSLYNSFTVPIELSFNPQGIQGPLFVVINYSIDFMFFLDMLINFRSSYVDDLGIERSTSKEMANNYFSSTFFIDFLATVPFGDILLIFKAYRDYREEAIRNGDSEWV